MELTLQGVDASLRWGYHAAATLRGWRIERDERGWGALTATVIKADTFRLSQRPLVFAAAHTKGTWRWNVTELQISGAVLTARLGQREL